MGDRAQRGGHRSARANLAAVGDVAGWPEWNGDIERIELIGPFAAGSRIVMTPVGDEAIELRVAEAVEPELFVDEADMGEIVVRTIHRVGRIDSDRVRVTCMEITGPAGERLHHARTCQKAPQALTLACFAT